MGFLWGMMGVNGVLQGYLRGPSGYSRVSTGYLGGTLRVHFGRSRGSATCGINSSARGAVWALWWHGGDVRYY